MAKICTRDLIFFLITNSLINIFIYISFFSINSEQNLSFNYYLFIYFNFSIILATVKTFSLTFFLRRLVHGDLRRARKASSRRRGAERTKSGRRDAGDACASGDAAIYKLKIVNIIYLFFLIYLINSVYRIFISLN